MKKVGGLFLIVALVSALNPSVFADTTSSGPITTKAEIPTGLTLSVALHKNSTTGALVNSMDFGILEDIGTGTLRSTPTGSTGTGNITAVVSANAQGQPYQVKQTGTALSNGQTILPIGACTVVPVYASQDNGGAELPSGASLGTAGTWVATDKVLYTSDASGALRAFQAIYSVTDDDTAGATEGVPQSQPGGVYNGVVTFTVTT